MQEQETQIFLMIMYSPQLFVEEKRSKREVRGNAEKNEGSKTQGVKRAREVAYLLWPDSHLEIFLDRRSVGSVYAACWGGGKRYIKKPYMKRERSSKGSKKEKTAGQKK